MKESEFRSYDELPLFLSAKLVAQTLGVSISSAYGNRDTGKSKADKKSRKTKHGILESKRK